MTTQTTAYPVLGILGLTGMFATLFAGSACLFWSAPRR